MKQSFFFALALTISAASVAGEQAATPQPPPTPDVQTLGPQVGARVPDFSLADQHGRVRTLKSILGPKGAVLVFFRSADW